MNTKNIIIPTKDYRIMSTCFLPEGIEMFPLVLMQHGLGSDRKGGGMFAQLAEHMAEKGIASICMDFAGHGESELSLRENNIGNMIDDSYTVLDWALENLNVDQNRLGLFGHSMGGRIALLMTADENAFTDRVSPYTAHVFLAPGTQPFLGVDFDAMHTQAKADGFYLLRWYGKILELSLKWFDDMAYANGFVQNLKGKRANSLIVAGSEDDLLATNRQAAQIIGADFIVIPQAGHGFGFWSNQPEVRRACAGHVSEFFVAKFL